jgi:hypothetical protein
VNADLPEGDAIDSIVLVPRGEGLPACLRAMLDESWRAAAVDDAHLAMVELCERRAALRRAWAPERARAHGELNLVIAASADEAAVIERLIAAVERYVPEATVWCERDGELAIVAPQGGDAEPRSTAPESAAPDIAAPPENAARGQIAPGLGAPSVTAEEIEMLLRATEESHR